MNYSLKVFVIITVKYIRKAIAQIFQSKNAHALFNPTAAQHSSQIPWFRVENVYAQFILA